MTYLAETLAAAEELARAGRWQRALSLLDAAESPEDTALTAVEVALQSDLFAGTALAGDRLATAEQHAGDSWDLDFLRLRHDYLVQLAGDGAFQFGPDGKDAAMVAQLRKRATDLSANAPDATRQGWARMYLGLILDNLFADREAAPEHYQAALRAGEGRDERWAEGGDDLLTREALRHLGDHDRETWATNKPPPPWPKR
jgi:hypothetical protein